MTDDNLGQIPPELVHKKKASPKPEWKPSERQIAFAKDLGVEIPVGVTPDELRDIIDSGINHIPVARSETKHYADLYHVPYTKYTNDQELFSRIIHHAKDKGTLVDVSSWFLCCLYLETIGHATMRGFLRPDCLVIRRIAEDLSRNPSFCRSLKAFGAHHDTPSEPGKFWAWYGPSKRSIAYMLGKSALRAAL
jgi:hypothetical protein